MAAPGTTGAMAAEPLRVMAAEPLTAGRVAQRWPTSTDPTLGNVNQNLYINMDVMRAEPKKLAQAAELVAGYPNVTLEMLEMSPDERLTALQRQMEGNLHHLYVLMPKMERGRASQWYPGANRRSLEQADKYGLHPNATAGAYATLSPSKDWYQNRYQSERLLEILDKDPVVTMDMLHRAGTVPFYADNPAAMTLVRSMLGKRISSMTMKEQALFLRLFDETENPEQTYRSVLPEGDLGEVVLNKDGTPRKNSWQSGPNILKAIQAINSDGDMTVLSPLMGAKHKVRNFYNNIAAPWLGERFGDFTADTHHIAASLLRPIAGSSPEVIQGLNIGSEAASEGRAAIPAGPQSARTGLQGLYPLYADAGRQVAADLGIAARALQSITWEAARALFTKKNAKIQAAVDAIWRQHATGRITADEARRQITAKVGNFTPPVWR
jgi:hypothetical protein